MKQNSKSPGPSGLMDVLQLPADLLAVNLLWLLTSLPVFTVGAASSAAYSVLLRYAREGGIPILKNYFHAFKENFLQATALWLTAIAMALVVWVDGHFAGAMAGAVHTLYLVLSVLLVAAIAVILTMAIPLQAYYRNSLKNILKNAFAMALCAPGWMLLIWLIWAVPAVLFLLVPSDVVLRGGFLVIMWGFSLPAYLASRVTLRIFRIFDPSLRSH